MNLIEFKKRILDIRSITPGTISLIPKIEKLYNDISIPLATEVVPNEVLAGGSWDIYSILKNLCKATDILLHEKDYDGHGYEEMQHCLELGKKIVNDSQREA